MKTLFLRKSQIKKEQLNHNFENLIFFLFCIVYIIISLSGSVLIYTHTENIVTPKKFTICLDAGHGGIDGGATGSFTKESEINLSISKKLTKLFISGGYKVVNTRTEDICLCEDISSPSFKLDDMKKRREIITHTAPDILISIHCNKFHLSSCVGAQVFFQKGNEKGEELAMAMTEYFVNNLPNARNFPLSADYYVLDSVTTPAVLVECGYLSNLQEEKLLSNDDYQDKIAYSIYAGTMKFIFSN